MTSFSGISWSPCRDLDPDTRFLTPSALWDHSTKLQHPFNLLLFMSANFIQHEQQCYLLHVPMEDLSALTQEEHFPRGLFSKNWNVFRGGFSLNSRLSNECIVSQTGAFDGWDLSSMHPSSRPSAEQVNSYSLLFSSCLGCSYCQSSFPRKKCICPSAPLVALFQFRPC